MRRIALINQKGGVGKTTTAVNLAAALARAGRRCLLVDMDPQSNATVNLGYEPNTIEKSVYDLLSGSMPFDSVVIERSERYHLVPSSIDLSGAELEFAASIGRESLLVEALGGVAEYDYVILDCPPSLGLLNINALAYVNEVFIPLQCEFFALQGISMLQRTVDLVKTRINPRLEITGVLAVMFDSRTVLAREVFDEIKKYFARRVFETVIRKNIKLAEAPSFGKTIFEYDIRSRGAEDYERFAVEVLAMEPGAEVRAPEPDVAAAGSTGFLAEKTETPSERADNTEAPAERAVIAGTPIRPEAPDNEDKPPDTEPRPENARKTDACGF